MYNLLLILLTLKEEHVDRDLTYEGLVGFDDVNTKVKDFSGAKDYGFVSFGLFYHSNQISRVFTKSLTHRSWLHSCLVSSYSEYFKSYHKYITSGLEKHPNFA